MKMYYESKSQCKINIFKTVENIIIYIFCFPFLRQGPAALPSLPLNVLSSASATCNYRHGPCV